MLVTTRAIDEPAALLSLLPDRAPGSLTAWVRGRQGLVGWGVAARAEFRGAERFSLARAWWDQLTAACDVDDAVRTPGTGPVVFGSFAFADDSASSSVLVLPETVVGIGDGRAWVTTVDGPAALRDNAPRALPGVDLQPGPVSADEWPDVVARAVDVLGRGDLQKVVLARQLLARLDGDLDVRACLARLHHAYPDAWTYCVGGMFGATPELLVARAAGRVRSLVLAGTVPHDGTEAGLARAAVALEADDKLREEHRVAVDSVRASLRLADRPAPFVLPQRAFSHLATELNADAGPEDALELASRLHPSAAVGGSPTHRALPLIAELERADRGRYAGPVGWMDARGDGEWGIALRGGELVDERTVRICVGGGIMPNSEPEQELAETEAKLAPMRTALGLDAR